MRLFRVLENLPATKWQTALLGVLSVVVLVAAKEVSIRGRKLPKQVPVPLIVLVTVVVISWAADINQRAGIAIVGFFPSSLPQPVLPIRSLDDLNKVFTSALMLAVLNYVQSVSLAVAFGKKKSPAEKIAPNRELFALGAASVVGSCFSCHTPAGAFTRSAVQAEAEAQTPLTGALVGVLILIFTALLSTVCQYIPLTVLAAIVLPATRSLISISEVKFLWRSSKRDFAHYMLTFIAVLIFDIQNGLLIGVGVSLLTLLIQSFRPRIVELGLLPHTDNFVALVRFPDAKRLRGLRILRLDSELHFGNVSAIVGRLEELLDEAVGAAAAPSTNPSGVTDVTVPRAGASAVETIAQGPQAASSGSVGDVVGDGKQTSADTVVVALGEPCATGPDPLAVTGDLPRNNPSSANGTAAVSETNVATPAGQQARSRASAGPTRQVFTLHYDDSPSEGGGSAPGDSVQLLEGSTGPSAASLTMGASTTGSNFHSPLRAVIVDASRIVRIDISAIKELQTCIDSFQRCALIPKPQLIFAGVPGPVRDAWDAYVAADKFAGGKATQMTQYLSVAAAVASVNSAAPACISNDAQLPERP